MGGCLTACTLTRTNYTTVLLSRTQAPLSASSASPCTAAASVGECWDSGCVLAPLDASVASPARVEAGHFWPPLLAPDGKQGFRGGEAVLEATVTFLPKSSTYMMYNEACDAIQVRGGVKVGDLIRRAQTQDGT